MASALPGATERAVERLVLDLEVQCRDDLLLVVTGAGISLASGIPTFRGADPGAVWKKDVIELGTRRYFEEDPVGSWRWYRSRFSKVQGAKPNAAHRALVDLEAWQVPRGEFALVTQNIDGLHRAAGSRRLVEVHGRADQVRCSKPGCEHAAPAGTLPRDPAAEAAFDADPRPETVPRCPACGSLLRQHVLWFDETYDEHESYDYRRVIAASGMASAVWFIGTSLSVGVTDMILRSAVRRGAPVALFDPRPPAHVPRQVDVFEVKAEEVLPIAAERVGATAEGWSPQGPPG